MLLLILLTVLLLLKGKRRLRLLDMPRTTPLLACGRNLIHLDFDLQRMRLRRKRIPVTLPVSMGSV